MLKGSEEEKKSSKEDIIITNDPLVEGIMAKCVCGSMMDPKLAKDVYEKHLPIFCNECWAHVPANKIVYNCPKQRCWEHMIGYDLCFKCALLHNRIIAEKSPQSLKNKLKSVFSKTNESNNNNAQNNVAMDYSNIYLSPSLTAILTQDFNGLQFEEQEENVISHSSVIDEISRLSALSISTLAQLSYDMQDQNAQKTNKTKFILCNIEIHISTNNIFC